MLLSGRVWKVVRRKWIQLLVEIGMKNPRNKIHLSELYIKHYKTLMTDFLGNCLGTFPQKVNATSYHFIFVSEDDQESSDATIANLTVQIFTVPSVAQHLVQKHNSFKLLIEFFTSHFSENAKLNSDSEEENDLEDIDLTDWMHERQTDFTRLMHVIHDIEHILVSTQYTQCTQCGNVRIFLSFTFYVKSILENLEVLNMLFFAILGSLNFVNLLNIKNY